MAVTNEEIQQWFQANPNVSNTDIYSAMQTYGVNPQQLTTAMGFNPEEVQSKYAEQQALAQPSVVPAPGITNLMPNTPATPAPSVYNPSVATQSFADVTPASMGIAALTPQATTPAPVTPPAAQAGGPKYANLTDQEILNWFQNFATQNSPTYYKGNVFEGAQQVKDALTKYNADPNQVNRILQSGATVPIYGGAKYGGEDINLRNFADELAMATSKTPMISALGKLTLDPAAAAQAAQNELDTLFDPNKGSLMPIKNSEFELGGKYYGQVGNRDKMIADWYNDPANKAKIEAAQKTVFDKYGVPTSIRRAPRAIAPMLAKNEIQSAKSEYIDPVDYKSYKDYTDAVNASELKRFENEIATNKKYGIDLMNQYKTAGNVASPAELKLAKLKAGLAGRNEEDEANFYGLSLENFRNAQKTGVGSAGNLTGSKLLTPIQRVAEQTARAAGLGKPDAKTLALAKKYPEVFAQASQEWANYLKKTFPGTKEYEGVLAAASVADTKKKASGGTIMPNNYRAGGRVKLI